MNKLIVCVPLDENNQPKHAVVKESKDKEGWVSVMVKQTAISMSATKSGGFVATTRSRSAYWQLQKSVADMLNLREGDDINAKLAALGAPALTIARKESFEKAYDTHSPKINPETKEAILFEGQAIYLQDYVAPLGTADVLISSKVTEEAQAPAVAERGEIA